MQRCFLFGAAALAAAMEEGRRQQEGARPPGHRSREQRNLQPLDLSLALETESRDHPEPDLVVCGNVLPHARTP